MAHRGRQTSNKRFKEQQRKERQLEKAARRQQRKLGEKPDPNEPDAELDELIAQRDELMASVHETVNPEL